MLGTLPCHSRESGNLYKQKNLDSCLRRNDNTKCELINHSIIRIANRLDAEYFQQKFLKLQKKLERKKYIKLTDLCEFIRTGPAGGALLASKYKASGIKVVRPSNLNGWNCDNAEIVYISENYYKTQLLQLYKRGDILITRIGDVKFGIIGDEKRGTISSNLIALRTKRELLDPYFLLAFLNTNFGKLQINRGKKVVSLASIGLGQVSNMLVPAVPAEVQSKIGNLVKRGLKKIHAAKKLYSQAENDLQNMAGSTKIEKKESFALINLSRLRREQRADAQYFLSQKYNQNKAVKIARIGEIAQISRGIDPGSKFYRKSGKLFLRVSNISKYGLSNKSQKYISVDLFERLRKKYQPQTGEILLVKDGKPGIALVLHEPVEGIISAGIVRLKLNSSMTPEYISLCINSQICQSQIQAHKDGSLMPHLKIEEIRKLEIPVLTFEERKNLTDNVKKSLRLFREGNNDLAQVVKKTESLIDG